MLMGYRVARAAYRGTSRAMRDASRKQQPQRPMVSYRRLAARRTGQQALITFAVLFILCAIAITMALEFINARY